MTDKKSSATTKPQESTKHSTPKSTKEISNENNKTENITQGLSASITSPKAQNQTETEKLTKPTAKSMKNSNRKSLEQTTLKTKISKTAIFSLILVIIAIAGIVSGYLKTQQQLELLKNELTSQNEQRIIQQQTQVRQQLAKQSHTLGSQIANQLTTFEQNNQTKIAQLEKVIENLSQSQSSDWSIYEAEYLIRIASRSVWLNQDTKAAINLLIGADDKFKQLNNPKFLPIRQLIREDIAALKLMPILAVDETVLSLMALNQQVNNLPLAFVHKQEIVAKKAEPTNNIDDWQSNLKITWDNFVDDYFTLRPINANIQPLLSPEQQQNLRQNLSLKIQLAIWAATEQKPALFKQATADINLWIRQYFDMEQTVNITFTKDISSLNNALINFDYSAELLSLKAVRKLLDTRPLENLEPKSSAPTEEQPEQSKPKVDIEKVTIPPTNSSPTVSTEEGA